VITASATTADGNTYIAGTWTNQAATVAVRCADGGADTSGIATNTVAGAAVTTEGASQSVTSTGACVDNATNAAATATFGPIKIDTTAPTFVYTGNAGTYAADQTVTITCTPSDNLSGVASSTCANITGPAYSFALGTNAFSATATDNAGNAMATPTRTSFTVTDNAGAIGMVIGRLFTTPGVAASLQAQARAIATSPNANAKAGKLNALSTRCTRRRARASRRRTRTS
jgi:hypothetical protein